AALLFPGAENSDLSDFRKGITFGFARVVGATVHMDGIGGAAARAVIVNTVAYITADSPNDRFFVFHFQNLLCEVIVCRIDRNMSRNIWQFTRLGICTCRWDAKSPWIFFRAGRATWKSWSGTGILWCARRIRLCWRVIP